MPPWKPEPGVGDFVGVRRLTDEQIALVERWVTDGMIEGQRRARVPAIPPAVPSSGAWRLGPPDLVLTMPAYTLRAGGDDMYRHFVLPISIPAKRYVKAWELRPGNLRVVHHATMEVDATGMSRHLDEQDPAPGYEGLIAHTSMAPDGYFLDWAPGHTPYVAPDGMAFPIEAEQRPGSDAAHAAERQAGSRAGERRPVLHRYAADARACLAATDAPGSRHPGGRVAPRGHDIVPAAGRRRRVHGPTARAQPGQGDRGLRDSSRWNRQTAVVGQELGLQLAGRLPVRHAGGTAGGLVGHHAVDLRQLVRPIR